MNRRLLVHVLILLLGLVLSGCDDAEKTYYEIPKSEVADVSSINKESAIAPTEENIEGEPETNEYFTYTNERFGYSVDVPDYLKPDSASEDDDGVYFQTVSGDIYLSVYGSNYPSTYYDYPNIDDIYVDELANMEYTPKFTDKNDNSFEINWEEYNTAYWRKYFLKSDDTENVLVLSYPVSREKELEDDIKHILDSFETGVGYDSDVEY
jgi:hypothetical protein